MATKPGDRLKKIAKEIEKNLGTNKELDFILEDVPQQIEKRTRLGKGVSESGANEKLAPLTSEKYIDKRKNSPELSSETTAKKSNLTFTGLLLSSIIGKRKSTLFTFFFDENRKDGVSNSDLAKWQALKGRRFFDLSKSERVGLSRKISKVIKASIKKLFDN